MGRNRRDELVYFVVFSARLFYRHEDTKKIVIVFLVSWCLCGKFFFWGLPAWRAYLPSFLRIHIFSQKLYPQINIIIIQLLLMSLVLVVAIRHLLANQKNLPIKWLSVLWTLLLMICLLWNLLFYQEQQNIPVIIINVLLFSSVIGLIHSGLAEHKSFYVNSAFSLFTITLLSRYFDTFWGLMDRSLFFIIGGLLLIFGGYWLEKKRRQLNRQSDHEQHQSIEFTGDHNE